MAMERWMGLTLRLFLETGGLARPNWTPHGPWIPSAAQSCAAHREPHRTVLRRTVTKGLQDQPWSDKRRMISSRGLCAQGPGWDGGNPSAMQSAMRPAETRDFPEKIGGVTSPSPPIPRAVAAAAATFGAWMPRLHGPAGTGATSLHLGVWSTGHHRAAACCAVLHATWYAAFGIARGRDPRIFARAAARKLRSDG